MYTWSYICTYVCRPAGLHIGFVCVCVCGGGGGGLHTGGGWVGNWDFPSPQEIENIE